MRWYTLAWTMQLANSTKTRDINLVALERRWTDETASTTLGNIAEFSTAVALPGGQEANLAQPTWVVAGGLLSTS